MTPALQQLAESILNAMRAAIDKSAASILERVPGLVDERIKAAGLMTRTEHETEVQRAVAAALQPMQASLGEAQATLRDAIKAQEESAATYRDAAQALIERAATIKDGEPGPAGRDGQDGASVDEEAVVARLRDVITEEIKAIPTPKDGRDGKDADVDSLVEQMRGLVAEAVEAIPKPKDGQDGRDGRDADPDELRAMVQRAVDEIPRPADGRDGLDGDPGRDAAHIDVLPAIDETRSYARGTYAHHRGGIWRSHKPTKGLDGWECIVRGLDEVAVQQAADDPRLFVARMVLSDGSTVEHELRVPAVIDRGLFKEGSTYAKGDGVTWGRHYWIAQADTSEQPGYVKDGAWRLSVKSGRDGMSAFDVAKRNGFAGTEAEWLRSLKAAPAAAKTGA